MGKKYTAPKFAGALAEPIYEPVSRGVLQLPDDSKHWEEAVLSQLMCKLALLLRHYEIDASDPDRWLTLSFRLGRAFVPGMKVVASPPPKRGRKRIWKAGKGDTLISAVHRARGVEKITISQAIAQLRRSDPTWREFSQQSLETRYREAKRDQLAHRKEIDAAMALFFPKSPAGLAEQNDAGTRRSQMGGVFGLASLATQPQSPATDEKTEL
jgi:hypothetical protein